ncbi:AAA family ATPase, partial [bacterium CPR1]|nr:AAA family ATPase [bacterium CPR1]
MLEIDAASHTQVEKIRDFIVDKVHFSPVSARFKVYIIDEVHKLSGASFNALLKTLEEPPSHVVFILATTHPHEVLPTILSRCQRYDFRALPLAQIRQHVLGVASAEGLSLDADAANLVARAADGSLRDALVFLEQCVAYAGSSVSREQAESILGLVGIEQMEHLTLALSTGGAGQALDLLRVLAERGLDLKRLLCSFQDVLRTLLLLQAGARDSMLEQRLEHERDSLERLARSIGRGQVMAWLRLSLEMAEQAREFSDLLMLWEIYLVRMACPELDTGMEALLARVDRLEQGARSTETGHSVESRPLERPAAAVESRPVERPAAAVESRPVERPAAAVESRPVERPAAAV